MAEHERTVVATVRKPHGVKGGLKVSLHGVELIDLQALTTLFVKTESGWQPYELTQVQGTDTDAILIFDEISSREAAELLRGQDLWANEDDLPPLEEFEFYVEDLEGCEVYDSEGKHFGKVTRILLNADQDILEVIDANGTETLFPFVEDWVELVDLEQQRIVVTASEIR